MEIQRNNNKQAITGSVIAAVCIIIYLFALVQATVRMYLSIDQRKTLARQEFTWISGLALNFGKMAFMDERFISMIDTSLRSSKTIEALIVTGADNGYAFEKKTGDAITWVNNSPRFRNRFNLSNQDLYSALDIGIIRNANIKGIASAFDYADITKILKETLLIILVGLVLAFFTILLHLLAGKPKGTMIEAQAPLRSRTPAARQSAYTPGQGPKGLYSPRGNIGWEEYLKERLDSELHRCASTEKDLTLVLIDFPGLADESVFKNAAEETAGFFTSRDLLFEYGKHGIAVILPGINLDNGIEKLENYYQRIFEKISSGGQDVFIGISSRSGRLLNSGRLMLEAGEALKKAKSSKTSIIAFKSDPEKYREFVRTHN